MRRRVCSRATFSSNAESSMKRVRHSWASLCSMTIQRSPRALCKKPRPLFSALAHGLTIAAFVCATLHISGGNFNPAVTFGLLCGGHTTLPKAMLYWSAQILGAFIAALICLSLFGRDVVVMGTPQLAINLSAMQGIVVEAILTF